MLISQKSVAFTSIDCDADPIIYETDQKAKLAAYKCGTEWATEKIASLTAHYKYKYPNSISNPNSVYERWAKATPSEIIAHNPCNNEYGPRLIVVPSYRVLPGAAGAYGFRFYYGDGACWNILEQQFFGSSSNGLLNYNYAKKCYPPYSDIEGECATFCPPYAPGIDLSTLQCIGDPEVEKANEQCESNPVVMNTGEKFQVETDLKLGAGFPIKVQRVYRSNRSLESKAFRASKINSFSPSSNYRVGWVKHIQPSSFIGNKYDYENEERHLVDIIPYAGNKNWKISNLATLYEYEYDGDVRISYGDKVENFIRAEDGGLTPQYLSKSTLDDNSSGERTTDKHWKYVRLNGEVIYFDIMGQVSLVVNPSGYRHYYAWENDLTYIYQNSTLTISDDFDNSVVVKFGLANTLTSVSASNGIAITYGYDKYANLTSVTKSIPADPINPNEVTELTKSYHYENTAFPYALTGITDEKGVRYATWTYDEIGRVIASKHANDVDKGTIEYELNTTTFTNSLGKQTKYNYATVSGAKRLVSVDGVATASCAAANQAYTYHPTGRIKTQTDWEGHVTYFEYNSKGQVTKRTDGYGTPEAYTVETSWHETLNEPSVITSPDKQETFKYNTHGKLINKSVTAL